MDTRLRSAGADGGRDEQRERLMYTGAHSNDDMPPRSFYDMSPRHGQRNTHIPRNEENEQKGREARDLLDDE